MAVIPIITFKDRHNIMKDEKDWAYGSDCIVAWVDEEDLVDNDDNLIQTSDLNKSIVLETQELMEFLTNKPKQDPGFTFI
tara:strand:+ start:292 stop:531 length:240 start_codon:yes stop_codon:yes gene_type:complete